MRIMSDGKSDGVALMYVKNGIVYPVALTQEQAESLDILVGVALGGTLTVIEDKPQGEIISLRKEAKDLDEILDPRD